MTRATKWLRLATRWSVLLRSLSTCLIVGTILVLINQGPALAAGTMGPPNLVQILLTYLVPFLVSTASTVAAISDGDSAVSRHNDGRRSTR